MVVRRRSRNLDVSNAYLGGTPLTATAAELNTLDGLTATTAELNLLDGATGAPVQVQEVLFSETAGAGTYTGTVALPAGAVLHDIIITGVVLWAAASAAAMEVGDGTDPNGYYADINLKATDLLAGETLSFALAGGKAGAYIANSQVTPRYSATARNIVGVVTTTGATGATGRTRMTVVYSVATAANATKVTA